MIVRNNKWILKTVAREFYDLTSIKMKKDAH